MTVLAFDNTFVGSNSGLNNISGNRNVFVGSKAGESNTTARQNTFVGFACGTSTTTGEMNTFIGNTSGFSNISGNFNVFIGDQSGRNSLTGANNVFVGRSAGNNNNSGGGNVLVGNAAGFSNVAGNNNTTVGDAAGFNNTGSNNTLIGNSADVSGGGPFINAAAIGSFAIVTASNKMILGNNNINVGIGLSSAAAAPANKLEIDAGVNGFNPTPAGSVGSSGLRLRDLHSTTLPIANPGTGFLSVDLNGDVIYVPGNNATTLGNACPLTPNPLSASWEIPLNNFNFVFSGQGVTNNNVGIGTTCSPAAKLHVIQSSTTTGSTAVLVNNTDPVSIGGDFTANGPYAIKGLALQQSPTTLTTTGVYGEARYISTRANYGVEGHASESNSSNYGGLFQATSSINNPLINYGARGDAAGAQNQNIGVNGVATGGDIAVGVFGQAFSGTTNYGIYGEAVQTGGGTVSDSYAGFFNGDVYINGLTYPSDITIKQNVDSLSNAIAVLKQLKPKTFEYNHAVHPQMNLRNGVQYGLIAQELEIILPTLVTQNTFPASYDSAGTVINPSFLIKGIDYQQLIPFLIKGMQEQQSTIDSLSQALAEVVTTVNSCCSSSSMQQNNNSQRSTAFQDVTLKDEQSIILDQNSPNPFAEQSTINYFLPDNVVKAQMLFYNVQGKLIQSVELTEKGKGSLNVFAQDLSNGIYTYTLVVDGKVFETKKMVKQK